MSAEITQEERDAINAAIAAGKVTRVPVGVNTQPQYRWCDKTNQLVQVEGMDISARRARDRGAANWKKMVKAENLRRRIAKEKFSADILALHEQGFHAYEIAEKLGRRQHTVFMRAREDGIELDTPTKRQTRERIAQATQLRASGLSVTKVSEAMGVSFSSAKLYLRAGRASA
jgi:transposase